MTCIMPHLRTVPGTYLSCVDKRLYLDASDITTAKRFVTLMIVLCVEGMGFRSQINLNNPKEKALHFDECLQIFAYVST